MKKSLPKIIAIVGPTASGKSDLAVSIAKKFNGEVISADSRQVYKGLDIGSGKITKKEMKGIPHHLLDVASPKKKFTVTDFKQLADKAIKDIVSRGKLPVICGGTGFYIDAVVQNILLPEVPPNAILRKKLEAMDPKKLYALLEKLDPSRAKEIDKRNLVRIVRAIEIAKALGKVPKAKSKPHYETLTIGTKWEASELQKRIGIRLQKRMRVGMITEAKKLHTEGLSWKRMQELGLEYRYLALHLQGKMSKDVMIEKLETEIRHYSKRQMTWFKRNQKIIWIEPNNITTVEKLVKSHLSKKQPWI